MHLIQKLQGFRLSFLDKELLPLDSVKDLGVSFDCNLTFNGQKIETVSSCMSAMDQVFGSKMF